jgi:hypothetical protein
MYVGISVLIYVEETTIRVVLSWKGRKGPGMQGQTVQEGRLP